MFGSTPVVSVRHSSSDEEVETETRIKVSERRGFGDNLEDDVQNQDAAVDAESNRRNRLMVEM